MAPASQPHRLQHTRRLTSPALFWCCWCWLFGLTAGPWELSPSREGPGPFSLWDTSFSVRSEIGHRDNVLLAATNQQSSGFLGFGADIFVLRLPIDGTSFNLLFTADDRRYFNAAEGATNEPGAAKEQSFLTHAALKKSLANGWSVSLTALHLYADQVFDASDLEVGIGSVQAQGHRFSLTPGIRRDFGPGVWMEGSVLLVRQEYREPVSSYWEIGPKFTLGWSFRTNSSIEVSLQALRRPFEDRFQMSRFGDPYPDLSLSNDDLKTELAWKQTWDEGRHWSTTLRGYHLRRVDNGEGWFDVDRFGVSGAVRYRNRHWEFSGTVRWSLYDYSLERASPLDPDLRTREDLELEGRVEYKFRNHWTVYGVYSYEQTHSNVLLDAYRMNTVFAGIEYEF